MARISKHGESRKKGRPSKRGILGDGERKRLKAEPAGGKERDLTGHG